jgi:hypothetical protein
MALYDNLFQPLEVGKLTIKNRIVRSPHGTGLAGEYLPIVPCVRSDSSISSSKSPFLPTKSSVILDEATTP